MSKKTRECVTAIYALTAVTVLLLPTERQKHQITLQALEAKARMHSLSAEQHAKIAVEAAAEAAWWATQARRYERVIMAAALFSGAFGAWLAMQLNRWLAS